MHRVARQIIFKMTTSCPVGEPDGAPARVRQLRGEGGQELPHHGRQLLHLQAGGQVGWILSPQILILIMS